MQIKLTNSPIVMQNKVFRRRYAIIITINSGPGTLYPVSLICTATLLITIIISTLNEETEAQKGEVTHQGPPSVREPDPNPDFA